MNQRGSVKPVHHHHMVWTVDFGVGLAVGGVKKCEQVVLGLVKQGDPIPHVKSCFFLFCESHSLHLLGWLHMHG